MLLLSDAVCVCLTAENCDDDDDGAPFPSDRV